MTLRLAAVAWAMLVLVVVSRVAIAPPQSHTVLPIYLNAAERFANGEPLYSPAPGLDVYRNPPGFAAGFVPFGWLPEKLAGIAWRLLGAGLFLAGLVRFGRNLLHLDDRGLSWLLLLAIPLAMGSLDNGQANIHLAGLLSLGSAAVGREKFATAAGWFAVAVGIKIYPLAVGLLASVTRPRTVSWLILFSLFALTFPLVLAKAEYVADQFRQMASNVTADNRHISTVVDRAPRDWTILARSWAGWIPDSGLVKGVSVTAGLAFAGLVFAARRKPLDRKAYLVFALGSIWMTLFGPATEPQTYTLLSPVLAATVLTTSGWSKGLAVVAWWLFTVPVIRDAFPNGWKLSVMGPQPVGATVLLAAVLVEVFGEKGIPNPGQIARWLDRVIPPVGIRKMAT